MQEQYFLLAHTLTSTEFDIQILPFYFISLDIAVIFFYVHVLYLLDTFITMSSTRCSIEVDQSL